MRKFLCYDLETTFLNKGQKRPSTRILEMALCDDKASYSRMVNPCKAYSTGTEIIESLEQMNQHPVSTLRFWSKLLVEKGALKSNIKRSSMEKQADAISTLLVRSDLAKEHAGEYSVSQWLYALENHHDKVKVCKDYLSKYKVDEKPKSLEFFTVEETLKGALKFGKDCTWVAHNGKSFDMPIVKGNCDRNDISYEDVVFADSLPMFKQKLEMDSYSQPNLYRSIFGVGYKAHHALDDAKALLKLVKYTAEKESCSFEELFKTKKLPKKIKIQSDLQEISGVGPKTVLHFKTKGIHNRKMLEEWVEEHSHEEFLEEFKGLYRYKKLAGKLYNLN